MELAEDDYHHGQRPDHSSPGAAPEKGRGVEIKGLAVEVLDVDQKRIKKLKMRRLPKKEQE